MRVPFAWRRRRAEEVDEEIATHLEMATRERIERGMPPDEARAAALREFGNVPLVQQTTREVWSWIWLEQLLQDVRFGTRILRHSPGFSAAAITLVALVIGGNTTIYSIVNALLVSPARGVTAERLVAIKHVEPGLFIADPFVSFPNYRDYARLTTSLQGLAGWVSERLTLGTETGNYAVFGALVTPNFFDTLGVAAAQGRTLQAADDDARDGLVVVISDSVWRERFAARPDIVGRTLMVNQLPATIVGVTAAPFAGAALTPREELWIPLRAYHRASGKSAALDNRAQPLLTMVGQRAPQASLQTVRTEFQTLAAQLHTAFPGTFTTFTGRGVTTMQDPRVSVMPYSASALLPIADMAPRFLALFSVVTVLTLLVVSANVANLMLGRAVERQRDTAVRRSLGAPRIRVLRMLAAEGATLAVVAWAASCLLAWWTARALLRIVEPMPNLLSDFRPDWTLAAYAMALAGAATLIFTMAPALRTWRLQVLPLLKSGEQSVAGGRSRASNVLVVMQLAFSVLLLTSAGLAYRSLSLMDSGDVGFDPNPILLATVRTRFDASQGTPLTAWQQELDRLERVREHLTTQHRVTAVTYSRRVPGAYFLGTNPVQTADGARTAQVFLRPVGPQYLSALGLAPLTGRDLGAADRRGSAAVAVINAQLALDLFGSTSALGQSLVVGDSRMPVQVVGVAPNALFDGPLHTPQPRYVFVPLQQANAGGLTDMTFFVRHDGPLEAITPVVARGIADIDSALPIVAMSTMTARLAGVTVLERQVTTLLVAFALASLIVAALGQYAVATFNMRRRTRDFGIRLALGASARRIENSVIREAFGLAVPGLLLGFVLSAGTAAVAQAVLFGVTPVDPLTYAAVFGLLALTSVAASYLPAWRAGRVDVVQALRAE